MWRGYPVRGLLRHMQANGALVYPSEVGRYRVEGCMALGSGGSVADDPVGNQVAPHCTQAFCPRGASWTVTACFSRFRGRGP